MLIDKLLSAYANLTSLTSSLAKIGDVIDLGVSRNNGVFPASNLGGWVITVKDATSGGSATLDLELITSATDALGSPTVLWTKTGVALASIADSGSQFFVPVPDTDAWLRFAAFRAKYGTAAFTAGTIAIEYTADFRKWRGYPAAHGF